jgi:hypothetical protein
LAPGSEAFAATNPNAAEQQQNVSSRYMIERVLGTDFPPTLNRSGSILLSPAPDTATFGVSLFMTNGLRAVAASPMIQRS